MSPVAQSLYWLSYTSILHELSTEIVVEPLVPVCCLFETEEGFVRSCSLVLPGSCRSKGRMKQILRNCWNSPNIMKVIERRTMQWAGCESWITVCIKMWNRILCVLWQERIEGILWTSERLVFWVAKSIESILWASERLVFWVAKSIESILWASERIVFWVAREVLKAFFGLLRD